MAMLATDIAGELIAGTRVAVSKLLRSSSGPASLTTVVMLLVAPVPLASIAFVASVGGATAGRGLLMLRFMLGLVLRMRELLLGGAGEVSRKSGMELKRARWDVGSVWDMKQCKQRRG